MAASAPTATAPRTSPARCPPPRASPPRRSRTAATPTAMYRTITDGFGQMAPQTWMVPRQKYDVIHYIREAYLKPHNPGQYAAIDRAYLDRLPKGTTRGPAPSEIEPWVAMDYGPSLMATCEVGDDASNVAYKGIAVRLDPGQGGVSRGRAWVALRPRHAPPGGRLDRPGLHRLERHQLQRPAPGPSPDRRPGPRRQPGRPRLGESRRPGVRRPPHPSAATAGRYGPLPRAWAHYQGLYRHGDRVILAYTVGAADVLETPGPRDRSRRSPDVPIFTRTLEIGPSTDDLSMRVASAEGRRQPGRRRSGAT